MVVGPDDQIRKIEIPCPEYPGQWPESPGVTVKLLVIHSFFLSFDKEVAELLYYHVM